MRKFKKKPSCKNSVILKPRQLELPRKIKKAAYILKFLHPPNKRRDSCNVRHPKCTIFNTQRAFPSNVFSDNGLFSYIDHDCFLIELYLVYIFFTPL